MNKQPLRVIGLLLGLVIITVIVRSLLLQGLSPVRLKAAPPLAGAVSQGLGTTGSKTALQEYGKDFSLRDIHYFKNGQWVVVTVVPVKTTADTVYIVMEKIGGVYQVVLGPGNIFSSSYKYTLPAEISQYLNQKGLLHG